MAKWLCENIRNENNEVIDLTPKFKTNSNAKPRNGDFSFCYDTGDVKNPMVEKTENGFLIIENDNLKAMKNAKKTMKEEIELEAMAKLSTSDKESMFAYVNSYLLRIMIPIKYVGLGLVAEIQTESFMVDDLLNTEEKIFGYYSELLFELDMHRKTKIDDYLSTKQSLGF